MFEKTEDNKTLCIQTTVLHKVVHWKLRWFGHVEVMHFMHFMQDWNEKEAKAGQDYIGY